MNVLQITDGITTVDLATASGHGIRLLRFRPPTTNRKAIRSGPGPGVIGERTMVSTLGDAECEIQIRIEQSPTTAPRFSAFSAFDTPSVEAQYIVLVRLLELARGWEEQRTGNPVRLVYQRDGAANTTYWTITGATLGESSGPDLWLLIETANSSLTLTFTLTVEPVAHAASVGNKASSVGITTVLGSNVVNCGACGGSVEGPLNVAIAKTSSGNDWTQVWISQVIGTPDFTDYSGTVEAGTYGGQCQQATYTFPTLVALTGSGYVINTSQQYPIRGFIRMKVTTAPTAGVGAVQIRMRINYGTSTGTQVTLPWVNFGGTLNNYFMVDLGSLPKLTNLQNRENQVSANYFVTIEMQSADTTTFTVRADYATFFAYTGFVKLTGVNLAQTDVVTYESTYTASGYAAPRLAPQTYETNSAGALQANAARYGRLARVRGNTAPVIWVQAQSDTLHQIADTGTVTVEHLACYALGEAA